MFKSKKGKWLSSIALTALVLAACTEEKADTDTSKENETESSTTQQAEKQIIVHADTINSHFQADAVCVVDSRFERGHTIVFRANVIDTATDATIEDAKVKTVLANGEEFEMKIGPHGEEGTLLYTVSWQIPDDFPTGTLDYEIIAEVDGKEYNYKPFDVSLSKLTVLEKGAEAKLAEEAALKAAEAAEGEAS